MEPYRLCLAHTECTAVSLNTDLSFATLKARRSALRAALHQPPSPPLHHTPPRPATPRHAPPRPATPRHAATPRCDHAVATL
eukprot:4906310-Prymnesium_polylepis.1